MLDSYSRKVLKYIKQHKQASFAELLRLGTNEPFMAQVISELLVNGLTIQVGVEDGKAVYELQSKGYAVLEEHKSHVFVHVMPVIISIISLVISMVALFKS